LEGNDDAFGVGCELFFVSEDEGVEAFEGFGLGDGVAFGEGAEEELVVRGIGRSIVHR